MKETFILPSNIEIERMVLASMLGYENLLHAARPLLAENEFSTQLHQRIFSICASLYDSGVAVDAATVGAEFYRRKIQEPLILSYLVSLNEGLPELPAIDAYVQILRDLSLRRTLIVQAENLQQRAILERGE